MVINLVTSQNLWESVSSGITSTTANGSYNFYWKLSICEEVMAIDKGFILNSKFQVV